MRWTFASMLLVACLVAQPASAQEIDETLFFPVVARTAGVGETQWVSDLTVHNLNDFAVTVGLQFFPANQANAFSPLFPHRLDLEARETMIVEDVLASIFGYTSDVKGALLVTTEQDFIPGNPEDADIAAITRTYNVGSPEGTFGQTEGSGAFQCLWLDVCEKLTKTQARYRTDQAVIVSLADAVISFGIGFVVKHFFGLEI